MPPRYFFFASLPRKIFALIPRFPASATSWCLYARLAGVHRPGKVDWLSQEDDFSLVSLVHSRDALYQGRFPGGVVADQLDDFAWIHVQADVIYGGEATKALDQISYR